jgi:hypothetical protein
MSAIEHATDGGPAPAPSPSAPWPRRVGRLAARAWRMEVGVYQSLFRLIFRRPRVPQGASGFPYHAPVSTILLVFIVLSAVEIPILDLIVHRWPWVRIPILILGIWGVTWMVGLLFGFLTRPHAVGPEGIRVRHGSELDLDLPWDVIRSVERSSVTAEKQPKVLDEAGGRTFAARIANETNVRIELECARDVRLPHGPDRIEAVRLWVDDIDGFMEAVRTHIP